MRSTAHYESRLNCFIIGAFLGKSERKGSRGVTALRALSDAIRSRNLRAKRTRGGGLKFKTIQHADHADISIKYLSSMVIWPGRRLAQCINCGSLSSRALDRGWMGGGKTLKRNCLMVGRRMKIFNGSFWGAF